MSRTIAIKDVINCRYAVSSADGDLVYEKITEALDNNQQVIVSFKDISLVVFAFLNTAIGKLYGQYREEEIDQRVMYTDINHLDHMTINAIADNAISYYRDPEKYRQQHQEAMDSI